MLKLLIAYVNCSKITQTVSIRLKYAEVKRTKCCSAVMFRPVTLLNSYSKLLTLVCEERISGTHRSFIKVVSILHVNTSNGKNLNKEK